MTETHGELQLETIQQLPKVLLHDHLDGSLRTRTIIELRDDGSPIILLTDPAGEILWSPLDDLSDEN